MSQAELQAVVSETAKFLDGLEYKLREDVPEEKRLALRQCVDRVYVDKPGGKIRLALRAVPSAGIHGQATKEISTTFPRKEQPGAA